MGLAERATPHGFVTPDHMPTATRPTTRRQLPGYPRAPRLSCEQRAPCTARRTGYRRRPTMHSADTEIWIRHLHTRPNRWEREHDRYIAHAVNIDNNQERSRSRSEPGTCGLASSQAEVSRGRRGRRVVVRNCSARTSMRVSGTYRIVSYRM